MKTHNWKYFHWQVCQKVVLHIHRKRLHNHFQGVHKKPKSSTSLKNRWKVVYMQSLKYTNIDKEQQSGAERQVLQSNRNQTVKKCTLEKLRYKSPEHVSLEIIRKCPCTMQGVWIGLSLKIPSNTKYSMILWS